MPRLSFLIVFLLRAELDFARVLAQANQCNPRVTISYSKYNLSAAHLSFGSLLGKLDATGKGSAAGFVDCLTCWCEHTALKDTHNHTVYLLPLKWDSGVIRATSWQNRKSLSVSRFPRGMEKFSLPSVER